MITGDPFLMTLVALGALMLVSVVIIFISVAMNLWWGWHG